MNITCATAALALSHLLSSAAAADRPSDLQRMAEISADAAVDPHEVDRHGPRNVVRVEARATLAPTLELGYERKLLPWLGLGASVGGGALAVGSTSAPRGVAKLTLGATFWPLAYASALQGLRLGLMADVYGLVDTARGAHGLAGALALPSASVGYGWRPGGVDVTVALGGTTLGNIAPVLPWASVGIGRAF